MTDKPWSPKDLFKPSKEHPQGSSGEWMAEENEVMVRRIYKDGKLVATEVVQPEELMIELCRRSTK